MYRLTAANCSFTDNNNTYFPFTLEMSYTASGNIATKNVTADILSADNTVTQTAYEGNYTYNTGQSHTIATITGTDIDQAFTWDLNGNLSTHTDNIKSLNRYLCWDEENRLMAVKDQNYLSAYVYDAAGERVWKLSGEVTQMKINGVGTIDVASLSNKTLYVSPYVVYNQQGYSKHYYAGAERVSSRIGGGTMYGLQHPINDTVTPITDEYPELATHLWDMLERSFSECLDLITEYITYDPYMVSIQESASQNYAENNWYIYHSDHLGSSSFLTDASGDPTQHLQYLPFGENYIEQRASTDYYSPYTFSAKERDMETGYSYFGARYYDPNVSAWLSVDPLSDKYPSMSAFMYCEGKVMLLIDPKGTNGIKAKTLTDYFPQGEEPKPISRAELDVTMQESFQGLVNQINAPNFVQDNKVSRTQFGMENFASYVLDNIISEDPNLVQGERKPVNGVTVQVRCSFEDPNNPNEPDWQNRKLFSSANRPIPPDEDDVTPRALNPGMDGKVVPFINLENGAKLFYVILVVVYPEV